MKGYATVFLMMVPLCVCAMLFTGCPQPTIGITGGGNGGNEGITSGGDTGTQQDNCTDCYGVQTEDCGIDHRYFKIDDIVNDFACKAAYINHTCYNTVNNDFTAIKKMNDYKDQYKKVHSEYEI